MSSFPFLSVPWNYYFTKFISNWNIFSIGLFVYYFLPTLDFKLHRQEFCLEQSLVCNSISPVLVTQSCLILCNPVDYSLPGSSVHGISQARILKWVAISFCRASCQPRDWTQVSRIASTLYHLSHQGST